MDKVNLRKWEGIYRDHSSHKRPDKNQYFVGIASHEMKTPITTLKAYLQLLEKHLTDNGDSTGIKYSKKASESLSKIENVALQLLDYSTSQHEKTQINNSEIAFHKLVENLIESIQATYQSHEIIILNNPSILMITDKFKIEQVITNYICNAIKFSSVGGKVLVDVHSDGNYLTFSVHDNGIGIENDKINFVFDKYFRTDTASEYPGLGLGLHISSDIIKSMNGKVWAESELGKGSSFYFKIPLKLFSHPV